MEVVPKVEIVAKPLKNLSSLDQVFVTIEEPNQLMTISGAWIFEECPEVECIVGELKKWVEMYPVFKQVIKGTKWVDDPSFDLESHLDVVTLPSPGTKKELEDYLSKQMSTPLDMNKPLWKAHLIKGFNGNGGVYFVGLHHCIADGQGAIRMILSLTSTSHEEKILKAGHTMREKKSPTQAPSSSKKKVRAQKIQKLVESLPFGTQISEIFTLLGVFILFNLFLTIADVFLTALIVNIRSLLKWTVFIFTPRRVFNKSSGVTKRVAYSDLIDLQEVKAIGKETGATVNDVLVSNLTSTIRNYLKSTGELEKKSNIACLVPVSMRKPEDWGLGNKVSLILLELPVHIEDPLERLKAIKSRVSDIKTSTEILASYSIIYFGITFLPKFILKLFCNLWTHKFHVLFTNVPGPQTEISFAGKPIKEYYSFVPQPSKGALGVCVLSYNGKVSLSINCDEGHLTPDCGALLKNFTSEFEILKALVQKKSEMKNLSSSSTISEEGQNEESTEEFVQEIQEAIQKLNEEDKLIELEESKQKGYRIADSGFSSLHASDSENSQENSEEETETENNNDEKEDNESVEENQME